MLFATPIAYYKGFGDAANRLTANERKATYATIAELMADPKSPGANLHRVEKARDKFLWSARVNQDIRIILHIKDGVMTILHVDHHDAAYAWAENRILKQEGMGKPPRLVDIVEERVLAGRAPVSVDDALRPFRNLANRDLLELGVDEEQFDAVRRATEDSIFDIGLSDTVIGNLLNTLGGAVVSVSTADRHEEVLVAAEVTENIIEAPSFHAFKKDFIPAPELVSDGDFGVLRSEEDLQALLSGSWERWLTFIHPEQRALVEGDYPGPVRVCGSAGTGKTVVALHRANHLLRASDEARVLLTTLSPALAGFLQARVRKLLADRPRLGERLEVAAVDDFAQRLYRLHLGEFTLASRQEIVDWLKQALESAGDKRLRLVFILNEWDDVIDAQQIGSLEAYLAAERLGRKVRLNEERRRAVWPIFEQVLQQLASMGLITQSGLYHRLVPVLEGLKASPVEHVIVDECQDLSQAQVRFLAALGRGRANGLFFTGDLGQRIFQQPFSWKSAGIDLRGRTRLLRINYRTSQQIRKTADRLLDPQVGDADGEEFDRKGTFSAFGGPPPRVVACDDQEAEKGLVEAFLRERLAEGVKPHEIAVMVRSAAQIPRAVSAVEASGVPHIVLDERLATLAGSINVSTMHLAKGLEYRAVAVMACDDDVIPSPERLAGLSDQGDLREAYDLERHLLYVACTRARDHLLVTGVNPASEFLVDMR